MIQLSAIVVGIVLMFGIALAVSAGIAYLATMAYGFIAPSFGWPELSFWQVWAIFFLLGLVGNCFKSSKISKD